MITVGGGGIPVIREGNHLRGASAVIDKDWASARLAEMIDADMLIILTAVKKVAINFGKENEQWLDRLSLSDAERFIEAKVILRKVLCCLKWKLPPRLLALAQVVKH